MTDKPKLKYTMMLEIEIEEDFIDYLTKYNDIFMSSHSGYWAFGVPVRDENDNTYAWLVFEHGDEDKRPSDKTCERVVELYKMKEPLPKKWYVLDRDAAIKAWCEGVKRWGTDWYGNRDAASDDVIVQLVLLGEVRYG